MCGKGQKAPDGHFWRPPGALRFFFLYGLGKESAHLLRRLILLLPRGVGIGAQGEPGVGVPKHTGYSLHIYTALERHRSEAMPLWHNKDKSDNPCIATG